MVEYTSEIVAALDPRVLTKLDFYERFTSILSFDHSLLIAHPVYKTVDEYLKLIGEKHPQGNAALDLFFNHDLLESFHICLGRVVTDRYYDQTHEQFYLGIRCSPSESPFLKLDVWPPDDFTLKNLIPVEHRMTNLLIPKLGETLYDFTHKFYPNITF